MQMKQSRFLTVREAAQLVAMQQTYLYLLLKMKRVEGARKVAGQWRIDAESFHRQFEDRLTTQAA